MPRLGVPMLNCGTALSIMGAGVGFVRIAPMEPGGGGGGGPSVTGGPAIGWSYGAALALAPVLTAPAPGGGGGGPSPLVVTSFATCG